MGSASTRVRPVSAPASIPIMMAETAEELRKRPEIRKELERATGKERPEKVESDSRGRFWFAIYAVVFALCAAVYFVIGAKLVPLTSTEVLMAQRILRGVVLIAIVLCIGRAISIYGIARVQDAATRFTLERIERLILALAIAVIVVSIIFVNWYAAVAALGVGSIIVGLAVQ